MDEELLSGPKNCIKRTAAKRKSTVVILDPSIVILANSSHGFTDVEEKALSLTKNTSSILFSSKEILFSKRPPTLSGCFREISGIDQMFEKSKPGW